MKRFLASLMLLVLFSPFALRADEIIVGNGTSSSGVSPFGNSWDYSWMEMIYQSSDIGQACTITSLSYNCANPYQYNYIANEIKIYLAEVTKTEMTSGEFTPESELTLVYQGSNVVLGEEEWETINLSTPFEYSGVNNLVIVISKSADYFQPNLKWMNNNVANSIMFAYSDYDPSAAQFPTGTSYVYGFLPNVKLGIGAGSTPDPTIPAAPANLNATATGQTTISLTWDAVNGATSYNIYSGTTNVAIGLTTTSYTVENLTANTEYCYTVTAVNAVGESEASDEDCATTDAETDDEEEIVLLSDNFNDNNIDGWRTFQGDNDSYNWTIKTSGGIDNSSYIQSLSFVYGANINTDNYIVTTSQYYINASTEFSFYTCPKSSGYPYENFSVVISEDGENWIAVYSEMFDENTPTEFTKRTVALSSHAGKNVYIGLRHHDCDLYWCSGINVDNIELSNGSKRYVRNSMENITVPAGTYYLVASATEAFSVSINIDGNEEDPELLPVAEVIATEIDENVDITWSMETNTREYEFHSYKLFRAFGENEPIVLAENIAATTSSFQDDTWATAEAGAYKWGVAVMYTNTTSRDDAELLASEIVWSNIINKEDEEEPFEIVAPYDLTGEATYNDDGTYGVKLEWVIPYCVYDHFNIYRRAAGGTYEKIAETESLTYYDDVNADGTYYYQVTSFAEVEGVEYESEPATAADGSGQDFVEITLTSIEENGVQGLTIYPNPTKNNINITAENMTRITVTNALGQVMYNQEVVSDNEIINMAQYEAGVYMVRIVTENGVAVERITVVR